MFRENTHGHKMKNKRGQVQLQQNQLPIPSHRDQGGGMGAENQPPSRKQAQLRSPHTYNRHKHKHNTVFASKGSPGNGHGSLDPELARHWPLLWKQAMFPKQLPSLPPFTEFHRGQPGFPGLASILKHSGSWDTTSSTVFQKAWENTADSGQPAYPLTHP